MTTQGKRARWLATGVVGFAAVLGLGVPAHADTPLGIQTLGCIPQGANLMECLVSVPGRVAPST